MAEDDGAVILRVEARFDEKEVARCAFCHGHFADQPQSWADGAIRIPGVRPCSHIRPRLEIVVLRSPVVWVKPQPAVTADIFDPHLLRSCWAGAWYVDRLVEESA